MMWALRGTFFGIGIVAVGAAVFVLLFQWSRGPLLSRSSGTFDIRIIPLVTIYNAWFWAAFAACMVIGWALARSWPGRFSPAFWVVLAVIDLFSARMLRLFFLLMSKLNEITRQVTDKP